MRSSTLIAVLVRLTTAMAAVAPLIVFGFLYVMAVQPQREAARDAEQRLAGASAELDRQRAFVRRPANVIQISAIGQFDSRTTDTDSAGEVAEALEALLTSPAVGGVTDLVIETGAAAEEPLDPRIRLFGRELVSTPVTVAFEGRYDQIGRFFWNLRMLPTTFELRSVVLTPGREPLMHASVVLAVLQRKTAVPARTALRPAIAADLSATPEWSRNPFATPSETGAATRARPESFRPRDPEPIVSSILFSSGRRVARIDGRVVKVGDRVGTAVVRSIEADAVVLAAAGGQERRLGLERPAIRLGRR